MNWICDTEDIVMVIEILIAFEKATLFCIMIGC